MPVIDRTSTIDHITEAVRQATITLRAPAEASKALPTIDPDFAAAIIPVLFTSRPDRKHPAGRSTRVRTNPGQLTWFQVAQFRPVCPAGVRDHEIRNTARTTGRLITWHQGSGNLHGLFAAQWDAGKLFDGLDTLAQTILLLSGARFPALAAWERTGLIR